MKRSLFFGLMLFSLAAFFSVGQPAAAQDKEKEKLLSPPLFKGVPDSVDDLRAMEKQVQAVIDKVFPSTVHIQLGGGQGSGVIVSADGLVLTAGHVSKNPGDTAYVTLQNGKKYTGKSLGRNGSVKGAGMDSGMIQILNAPKLPFVPMGRSMDIITGQWCVAVGHPGGLKPNRGLVVRVGRILFNSNSFIRTDCALVGGDSGGPLFNMRGELIGIHSRIGDRFMSENMHVPIDRYQQTWQRLVKGDAWLGWQGVWGPVQSPDGKTIMEEKGEFKKKDPFDATMKGSHFKVFTFKMIPGFAYTIDMKSKAVDAYLRLEDSKGNFLCENDDGGGEQNSRIVYRPSRKDDYRIIATTFEAGQLGAYTVTVKEAENVVKDLPAGKVDICEAVKLPRPAARETIALFVKGGVVDPFATAHLLDDEGKPIASREAVFHWKSGKFAAKSDDQGQVRLKLSLDKLEGLMLEVPEGLKAMVRITDSEGNPLPIKTPGVKKGKFGGLEGGMPPQSMAPMAPRPVLGIRGWNEAWFAEESLY